MVEATTAIIITTTIAPVRPLGRPHPKRRTLEKSCKHFGTGQRSFIDVVELMDVEQTRRVKVVLFFYRSNMVSYSEMSFKGLTVHHGGELLKVQFFKNLIV